MTTLTKPLLRGHFHQAAFFAALGASLVLLMRASSARALLGLGVYALSLVGLFGISALYHRVNWPEARRMWMRRLDHAAIFVLIAGTATPLCLLRLPEKAGQGLLFWIWIVAALGILKSLVWVRVPKALASLLYVAAGCVALPYFGDFRASLAPEGLALILAGGFVYAAGAVVYALKRPNPWPRVFGYHEIFHVLVVVAAALHFVAIEISVR